MGQPDPFLCVPALYYGKDHRTSYETSNVDGVMDGDLRPFVEAYLRQEYEAKRLAAKQI